MSLFFSFFTVKQKSLMNHDKMYFSFGEETVAASSRETKKKGEGPKRKSEKKVLLIINQLTYSF